MTNSRPKVGILPPMLSLTVLGLLTMATMPPAPTMRDLIETYQADYGNLTRFYNQELSDRRSQRLAALFDQELKDLEKVDFAKLDRDAQVDYLLFKNKLKHSARQLELDAKDNAEIAPLIPFAQEIVTLFEDRQAMKPIDPQSAAKTLKAIDKEISDAKKAAENGLKIDKTIANRAAMAVDELGKTLKSWFRFFDGYDPLFSWWCREPNKTVAANLEAYAKVIREKLVGIKPDDKDTIIGHPIGRERLLEDLQAEMIPYTPEELLDIAKREYAWCEVEMKKAAKEMGFGDDWHKALEKVKEDHVGPGEQPKLIRELADEAVKFVKDQDIVTIPPLAEEIWRMDMMSPDRQKVSPFFLGGDTILVSFPTDEMTQEQKLMSMRANNKHFARATVFHELIPGHHLQGFMEDRYRPYRQLFSTPFWTEGWALWMEFLFWDRKFPKTPENRVGMLFWRMHRCVRIEFSLGFHLGKYTPQQCVDMLVEKVGHERSTAEGEVRRSFGGGYSPLYQAAYMLGALQFRSLAKECVGDGKMTYKQFHDAILHENNIQVAMVRAILTNQKLSKNFKVDWRFAD
ncbi:MAG: DUF885 family protein [Fimbriimonadaceae bacterium]|nr:DUF885 family protein [Fimbriimonadaceae bacterium]